MKLEKIDINGHFFGFAFKEGSEYCRCEIDYTGGYSLRWRLEREAMLKQTKNN